MESKASFNLPEKTKAKDMMREVEEKLKKAYLHASQAKHNAIIITNHLLSEEKKVKKLEEEKITMATFVKAI